MREVEEMLSNMNINYKLLRCDLIEITQYVPFSKDFLEELINCKDFKAIEVYDCNEAHILIAIEV